MRSDKAKNIDKVAAAIVRNPLGSLEELGKESGVSHQTVKRLRGSPEMLITVKKVPRIFALTEKDLELQELLQDEQMKRIKNSETLKDIRTIELAQLAEKSLARYMHLRGDATDKDGALKDTKQFSREELLDMLNAN
jgi:hypothetical protein